MVVADLNHDGKPDLIALASGMSELVWYENPTWQRHVLVSGVSEMINCVTVETPGDPIPQIVLASGFANQAKNSVGIVSLLRHQGDPREPWSITEIDRLTTSHRLRMANIDGSGKRVVINHSRSPAKKPRPPTTAIRLHWSSIVPASGSARQLVARTAVWYMAFS